MLFQYSAKKMFFMLLKSYVNFFMLQYTKNFVPITLSQTQICQKFGEIYIVTPVVSLNVLLRILKNHSLFHFDQLIEIAAIDLFKSIRRYTVKFLLLSTLYNSRVTIHALNVNTTEMFSTTALYKSAEWLEREIFESFGLWIKNHPDLRRLLTDYGFLGYYLRKDFPLTGFLEIYYNDATKKLNYENVRLSQEYRRFHLKSVWIKNYYVA